MVIRNLSLAFFCMVASWASMDVLGQDQTREPLATEFRVMSFNLRYGTARDGDNHWKHRRNLVVQAIESFRPDLLGTQETLGFQAQYLSENLPEYSYAGRSREDNDGGEQCGIFFRRSRFEKLIEGHFWLSEMPEKPGSKSWDSSLPRMATWLKLWDRENQKSLYVINTHFDHIGKQARTESAKLIRAFVESLAESSSVVVMGDFNAGEGSNPYEALFGTSREKPSLIQDTYRLMQPTASNREGTFNGFKGTDSGARIDWIGTTRSLQVESAEIVRFSKDGKYPSDHFPVTTTLRFKSK